MSDPFLGEIKLFAGNFAPRGWHFCDGALLNINQNQAVFALLGTYYGGDGIRTFALPDLRGRVPVCTGSAPDLSAYANGEKGGTETVALAASQIPPHNHTIYASTADGGSSAPANSVPATAVLEANHNTRFNAYVDPNTGAELVPMAETALAAAGGAPPAAHNNMMPFVGLSYIIALQGIFPSRS